MNQREVLVIEKYVYVDQERMIQQLLEDMQNEQRQKEIEQEAMNDAHHTEPEVDDGRKPVWRIIWRHEYKKADYLVDGVDGVDLHRRFCQ